MTTFRRRWSSRSAGAVSAAAVALLMSACGSSSSGTSASASAPTVTQASPAPGFTYLTEGTAADEYRASIADIDQPLPDGVDYPPGLPPDFVPTDGYLQEGAARNQAWFTWLCAWETEYLAAHDDADTDRVTTASAMLEWWATAWYYTQVMDDPDQGWVSNVLVPMRRGDPAGVKTDHQQICYQFPTVAKGSSDAVG